MNKQDADLVQLAWAALGAATRALERTRRVFRPRPHFDSGAFVRQHQAQGGCVWFDFGKTNLQAPVMSFLYTRFSSELCRPHPPRHWRPGLRLRAGPPVSALELEYEHARGIGLALGHARHEHLPIGRFDAAALAQRIR